MALMTRIMVGVRPWSDFNRYIGLRTVVMRKKNEFFDPNYEVSIYGSKPRTKTGGITMITLAPGMGGGAQWNAVREILRCAGAPLEFEEIKSAEESDDELDNLLLSIKRNGLAVKGNIETRSREDGGVEMSRNMLIRKDLDLFVRVNWFKSIKPLSKLMKVHKELDLVLIRQNTEGEFSLIEYSPLPQMCEHLAIVTHYNSMRIAEYAFKYSRERKRKKITLILNKMVVPKSEDIFSSAFLEVAKKYPDISYEVLDVARFTLMLQYESDQLDVILASSLYGSILSSILMGYIGSNELIPSLNAGDRYEVWEAAYTSSVHKISTPSDNPISHICIIISLLKHIGSLKVAEAVTQSLIETLSEGVKTRDIGGTATVDEFAKFMISCLKPKISGVQCIYDDPPTLPPKPPPTKPFQPEFMPGLVPPNPNYKNDPGLSPGQSPTGKKSDNK